MLKRLHKAMKLLRITQKLNRQGWRILFLTRWGPRLNTHLTDGTIRSEKDLLLHTSLKENKSF